MRRRRRLTTRSLWAVLTALAGLIAAGPARAAAPAPPCAALPCEGADPSAVTAWASAPRVVNQATLLGRQPDGVHDTGLVNAMRQAHA